MKIAFVKPDYGIAGGFEVVLGRLSQYLEEEGHHVEAVLVPVPPRTESAFGVELPPDVYEASHEYFRYMSLLESFLSVDVSGYDVVVSSQPPSFAVDHPQQLSIFYHHLRVFYDLSDLYLMAGFTDPMVHLAAQEVVRSADQIYLERVNWFVAPEETERRLALFNEISSVGSIHVTSSVAEQLLQDEPSDVHDKVLCVSRHEFPKRAELFVHAMKLLPGLLGEVVGSGGRLPWIRQLDETLSLPGAKLHDLDDRNVWLNTGYNLRGRESQEFPVSNVEFLEGLTNDQLADRYRNALCLVAPAFREDYGLTAIEAMCAGKPVIVCEDGGGLADMVSDGVNGFVVEPKGEAIAAAIDRLRSDEDLASEMRVNARLMAQQFRWERAFHQFQEGLERVLA